MLNLAAALEHSVNEQPDKTAIVFGDKRYSYQQINAIANQVANGLISAGITKGDKVALSCLNLPYFPMIYYGILKAGAVVVPINVLLKRNEIAYHLKDSEAKAYFCFQGTPELPMAEEGWAGFQQIDTCQHFWLITADPAAASPIEGTTTFGQLIGKQPATFNTVLTDFEDTAVVLYTSGTTGFPKGAELSHASMTMNAIASQNVMRMQSDDVHALVLPLFHSFGQTCQMNAGFSLGNTLVLIPRFTPEAVLSAIEKEKITIFIGVPTMYWALLTYEDKENQFDFQAIADSLRIGVSGASSLALEIIKGVEEKYNIPIVEGYGLSETCPVATFNHVHKKRKPGSVGTPIWGVEVKVFDKDNGEVTVGEVGEIGIRGHNVMKGYYNKPEATAKTFNDAGWFLTGDLGRMDEEGYLYIVDRVKDMVIRGGFNVYPREIEEVLMTHPAISMASVIGVKHDQHGEEIKAFVVLKEGANATPEEIISWSKDQMAVYKYPRIVEIKESLPMTATGKILKKILKAESAND
jgi:long-chain acyl-CoA synthetase